MSETGPSTTTTVLPNYPQGDMAEKVKQATGAGGTKQKVGDQPPQTGSSDIVSPGAPGGVTKSGQPPKLNADGTRSFYVPNDDANFLLTNMTTATRENVLKKLYERGQYGGAQRGNGLNTQDIGAMADLLYYANGLGIPWDQALVQYQRDFPVKTNLVPGSGRRAPIQVSNSDDIKKVFRNAAQQLLGRAVDDKLADSFVNMVQAEERARQQQYQTQSGGVVEQAPDVATMAQQQIESKFAVEQRVQNAANAASIIDNLVKGLAR